MSEKKVYRKKSRLTAGSLLALFFILLLGYSLLNAVWPKRTELELENRKAASFPSISVENLLNGRWQKQFGTYLQDQFALRDPLVNLQRAVDEIAFGKVEESGILIGKDRWMFTKQFTEPDDQLAKNVAAVNEFAVRHPGQVTFLLAPSAAIIYPEMLPAGAPMIDEDAYLDDIFTSVSQNASVLDLRTVFRQNKENALYYKTDHHWTTDGAYLAYQQFCAIKNLTPFDTASQKVEAAKGFLGTHYSATRLWNVESDTVFWYPLPHQMTIYQVTGELQYEELNTGTTINTDKLQTRDMYAAFLDGNNGYSVIEGDGEGSILIAKDSYANCFIPYLTANYAKIGVVDFRAHAYGLDALMEKEGYDEVLILYNFQTFASDNKFFNINRPSTT